MQVDEQPSQPKKPRPPHAPATMTADAAFDFVAANIRFGSGVTREIGMDLADAGLRRALVVTDATLARLPPVQQALESLEQQGVAAVVYDRVAVEPTDRSFLDAIA